MDVYRIDGGEGFYLACDLETLRKQKRSNGVVVKCNGMINDEIRRFKKIIVLDNGVNNLLLNAKDYYIIINENDAVFCLTYNSCQIIYGFKEEHDWKKIELEIVGVDLCMDFSEYEIKSVGKIMATSFMMVAKFSYLYGFTTVFDRKVSGRLADIFLRIFSSREMVDDELRTEEQNREKVIFFLSNGVMRKDFVDKYLYRHYTYTRKLS